MTALPSPGVRIDYVAVNGRGVIVRSFDDAGRARRWAWRHAMLHDGLHVRQVTVTVDARHIYTPPQPPKPAPRVREDFGLPAMGAELSAQPMERAAA